jgi:hypothetical protein
MDFEVQVFFLRTPSLAVLVHMHFVVFLLNRPHHHHIYAIMYASFSLLSATQKKRKKETQGTSFLPELSGQVINPCKFQTHF